MKISAYERIATVLMMVGESISNSVDEKSRSEIIQETEFSVESVAVNIPTESAVTTMSDLNLVYALYEE